MSPKKKKALLNESETQPEKQAENQAENPSQEQPENRSHKYDASFKSWMDHQAPEILPLLVPGVEYEQDLNVEVIPPAMRTDKVFQVRYKGKRHILHVEFQVSSEPHFSARLLVYNAMLHYKYECPVITIVIYPFRNVTLAIPPYVVRNEEEDFLFFKYQIFPLFEKKARTYVQQHQTCMYMLLPTMPDIDLDLMEQVERELRDLYPDGSKTFADQASCMSLLLERNHDLPELVKNKIREKVKMFEQLWEESPMVQKMRAQYYGKGKEEGEVQALQRTLVKLVQARFPVLTEFARNQAQLCKKPEVLDTITEQLFVAQDSRAVQKLLESLSEQ